MNRLEINTNNEKYYSKEFIQGFKCGTRCQFDDDMKVLEQIRQEIEQRMQVKPNNFNQHDESDYDRGLYTALNIIDKYKGDKE